MDGSVKDAGTRMWPQTERMKAALAMARLSPEEQARFEADAVDAWAGVEMFIFPENRGLFRDKMNADGAFIAEGALAARCFISYARSRTSSATPIARLAHDETASACS